LRLQYRDFEGEGRGERGRQGDKETRRGGDWVNVQKKI
jgi:hypothetical protein